MEEAYTELYREFLQLRLLCLKQASLLKQLTETLRTQQGGAPVPDGDPSVMASIPVQCTQASMVPTHNPAAPHDIIGPSGAVGSLANLLAGDLGRLRLDFAHPGTERKEVLKATPLGPLDLPGGNVEMAPSSVSGDSKQAGRFRGDDKTRQMFRMPSACGSFLDSEFLSQTGGMMLMSEVALQSQVCDFCNAVFPGHTTTRGDFMCHLHTHIT
ncbi:uncharacterized protein LOC121575121 isoform X2 [Coregonus clupeaformis]|uniref:Uncharacterized protein n=2 Tax=Coregonus TaxID=27772 RepID=A0AAN8MSJ8_9TELE|nr:uncharacterized protein LOC121575121 isoform X2 [Coregonus clupeaformis]XP_041743930.1 uncharacterized protein LOC121575121 isoform X2 [Coregonus clupeaformis]XP_041743931.1 uncharacterized protein LOC121575121 isoform X2 [Coregonus clupeaformis]XP_041743932.1 uncharacterized protein LOC121575121 isoform X2 [Coregonus clupeaformis]